VRSDYVNPFWPRLDGRIWPHLGALHQNSVGHEWQTDTGEFLYGAGPRD
jgi:hypothetical protein